MQISVTGCILRISNTGESHRSLICFSPEHGLLRLLLRDSQRAALRAGDRPDLFDVGSFEFQRKSAEAAAFIQEFHRETGFPQIARNYPALVAAASLARFYERNLTHLEHFEDAWPILLRALQALGSDAYPDAVLLKALFSFARSEGYPVVADWLERRATADRTRIAEFLRSPLAQQSMEHGQISATLQSLNRYLEGYTDLLPLELKSANG